ncbi:MAG: universal stress protein [Nitrososphaeraceae archaeon]|nr:universal stress protein [Nitrososphaeraceae archaeon]
MYKNILVPHAGTKAGDKALEHAKEMAKKYDSKITIIHVVEDIQIPPSLTLDFGKTDLEKEIKQIRNELEKEMYYELNSKANKLQNEGIPTTIRILHGYPDQEIIRIINENNYDIIVMAKRRKLPGLKGILQLGSISRKVLERVSCPVLLIDRER